MKYVFTFLLFAGYVTGTRAQVCSPNPPNPNATELGFNPNPIPPAIENTNYNHQNTVVIPEKVENTIDPNGDSLELCGIKIAGVSIDTAASYNGIVPSGFNFTWEIWQGNTQITASNAAATPINIAAGSNIIRLCLRFKADNVPSPIQTPCDTVSIKVLVQGRLNLGFGCNDVPSSLAPPAEFRIGMPICDASVASIHTFVSGESFQVLQNVPNPTDLLTMIRYQVPNAGDARIEITDALGRKVYNQSLLVQAGVNEFNLSTENWSNGLYSYTIHFEGKSLSAKLMVLH
jgi:hypothetical protein